MSRCAERHPGAPPGEAHVPARNPTSTESVQRSHVPHLDPVGIAALSGHARALPPSAPAHVTLQPLTHPRSAPSPSVFRPHPAALAPPRAVQLAYPGQCSIRTPSESFLGVQWSLGRPPPPLGLVAAT
ncbi:hypothetical protein OF83DRAFT_1178985 [Amylostereum chailletii]|nr:hypothetical protein OF83DRAFT_1178985 [Amylostereum chailletii]